MFEEHIKLPCRTQLHEIYAKASRFINRLIIPMTRGKVEEARISEEIYCGKGCGDATNCTQHRQELQ